MSQPPVQDDKDSIVTKEYLEEYLASVIQLMEERQKKQFDSLMTGIATTIDEKLDPIIARVNEHTQYINAGGAGGQPEQQQSPGAAAVSRKNALMDLVNSPLGQELMPVLRQRLGLQDSADPAVQEFRANTERLNQIVYRKAANLTAKMIEKAMKTSLQDEFTNNAAKDMALGAVSNHEPL